MDIFIRIRKALHEFGHRFGYWPNAIYVGEDEYDEMVESNKYLIFDITKADKVFGTRFYRVKEKSHLSVGVIMDETI